MVLNNKYLYNNFIGITWVFFFWEFLLISVYIMFCFDYSQYFILLCIGSFVRR